MEFNLLSLASSIALPKGDNVVKQQLDQQRQQAVNFRRSLEELEGALERQRQSVCVAARHESIWGMKPGSAAGGTDAGGEGTDIEVEEDAATEVGEEEEEEEEELHSSMEEDDALLVGELHDDDDDSLQED